MKLYKSICLFTFLTLFLQVTTILAQTEKSNFTSKKSISSENKANAKKVDQLFAKWDKNNSSGATIAVVRDGKILYKKGYGMANLEYDIPNRPDTIFHIASVSKQFTTFAILLLEKDGKLSLDDDVRKYIPEVPELGKTITLRHLSHHTSGLRDQWALIAMSGGRLDDVITKEHILKLVKRQKELNFEPGAEYMYSNTGYTLLAEVVARVSGKSFAEFTKERIFKPLKMKNTLFFDDHERIVKNRAYSYRPVSNGFKKVVLSYANVGATSLFTTVEDLSLWALNFENPIVGNRELMNKMKQRGKLNNGTEISYALGQVVGNYRGLKNIRHSGGDAGYRTHLVRFPNQRFSVIVFSNDGGFNAGRIAQRVTDIYLSKEIAAYENNQPKKEKVVKPKVKKSNPATPDLNTLKRYVGTYEFQPNFVVKITERNGILNAQATGQPLVTLKALTMNRFKVNEVDNIEVSFHSEGTNKANKLKLYQGGQVQEAKRVKPFDLESVKLSDFTGNFYSKELATEYKFVFENGKLIARHSRNSDLQLQPVNKDLFRASSWFFTNIKFVRNDKGEIIGCRVSNGRVRNLWFEKIKK